MPEPRACPVCSEPLADAPPRCFRCETPLAAWWPFEEGLDQGVAGLGRAVAVRPASKAGLPSGSRHAPLVAAAAVGVALGLLGAVAVFQARLEAPRTVVEAPGRIPSPVPDALATAAAGGASPRRSGPSTTGSAISYRVQRGDSLWRISAALTGDGRRWHQLWPELEGRWLRPGTVLVLPASQAAPPHE